MNSIQTVNGNKAAVVYFAGRTAVASFPARLNAAIPDLDEAEAILAVTWPVRVENETIIDIDSNKVDSKGRAIGFRVYVYQWIATGQWYAGVQNTRHVKGKWEDFGVGQRAKKYASQEAAIKGGTFIARERAAART